MAKQKNQQKQTSLEKLLHYVLGHQPDEFGLYPDENGFVALKELLAALHDEDGFRGVREGQIMMLLNQPGEDSFLEIDGKNIRLKPNLAHLPPEAPGLGEMPKMLYLPLKPSAWPVIHERGLFPKAGQKFAFLWADRDLALKIGRRLSPNPVLVSLQTGPAFKGGAEFTPYSERLWLTVQVEPRFLSGPPVLQKSEEETIKKKEAKSRPQAGLPGSFHVPVPNEPEVHQGKKKGKYSDTADWKNQRRREQRRHGHDDSFE